MYLENEINEYPDILPPLPRHAQFNDTNYLACMCHEIGTPLTALLCLPQANTLLQAIAG